MNKPVVFMFSGQGSQYYHMGKELYDQHPRFKAWMHYCDEIFQMHTDASLIEILYHRNTKHDPFDHILYSNAALLSIEFSLSKILQEMGIEPDYILGYSFGEVSASVINGMISLDQGMEMAVEIARLLENNSPAAGMLAVIDSQQVMVRYPEIFKKCWLACSNFHNSFVVSGHIEDIERAYRELSHKNILCQRLPVNYAFHTPILDPIKAALVNLFSRIRETKGTKPLVSTMTTNVVDRVDGDYFWKVIRYPVQFDKTVGNLLCKGDFTFIDVGPSGTLATFVKHLLPRHSRSAYLVTMNPYGKNIDSLNNIKNAV